CDGNGVELLYRSNSASGAPGQVQVSIAISVLVTWPEQPERVSAATVETWARSVIDSTAAVLSQCDIGLAVLEVRLWAAPPDVLRIDANAPDSNIAFAPDDGAEAFLYTLNETLPRRTRILFERLREGLPE